MVTSLLLLAGMLVVDKLTDGVNVGAAYTFNPATALVNVPALVPVQVSTQRYLQPFKASVGLLTFRVAFVSPGILEKVPLTGCCCHWYASEASPVASTLKLALVSPTNAFAFVGWANIRGDASLGARVRRNAAATTASRENTGVVLICRWVWLIPVSFVARQNRRVPFTASTGRRKPSLWQAQSMVLDSFLLPFNHSVCFLPAMSESGDGLAAMTASPEVARHLTMVPFCCSGKDPIVPQAGGGSLAPAISMVTRLGRGLETGGMVIRPR